ncbi:hypothetical protein WA158_004658 [Blastocystis sp. Blastoise]
MSEEIQWPSRLVRKTFIDYFVSKNHTFYKSSPVVPLDDPTLLFANAGMNQYKPIFLGHVDPTSPLASLKRACNSQKCIRAGGKHNDLEDVGKDVYHHTFFEMLGNWSFGDYFKKDAIAFAWELLTEVYKLDKSRLYTTYFAGDEKDNVPADYEARDYWQQYLPASHVLPFGRKENFWEMGEVGPCGPCSEIHYDRIGGRDASALVNQDDPNVLEIWNLVFMQFNRELDGSLKPLPATHVDTGMGFERITSVLQGKMSNYDTDVFTPIFKKIHELSKVDYYGGIVGGKTEEAKRDMAYRVVADHIRTLTFAITDGAVPSNSGRGYVLRRILRRGVRYGQQILKCEPGFFCKLVPVVVENMGDVFPEIKEKMNYVQEVILDEEMSFNRTLERGLKRFQQEIDSMEQANKTNHTENTIISGNVAFFLYGTLGFPIDLTELMAEENGYKVDMELFNKLLEEARELARSSGKDLLSGKELELKPDDTSKLNHDNVPKTDDSFKYIWYEKQPATILAIFTASGFVDAVTDPSVIYGVILDNSSFYGEQGGQVSDSGKILCGEHEFIVSKCMSYNGYLLHYGHIASIPAEKPVFQVGVSVECDVDYERRICIACNHTMTHGFNWALKDTLQLDIDQKGSLVDENKLRFDFNMNRALTTAEIECIEHKVSEMINNALPVYTQTADLTQARKISSLRAVFGETYPNPVRVVSIGMAIDALLKDPENKEWYKYSVEFCGGTHLSNTAQAKYFAVIEEGSIAKGIRRVTCVTHDKAYEAIQLGKEIEAKFSEARAASGKDLAKCVVGLQQDLATAVISLSLKNKLREELKVLEKKMVAEKKAAMLAKAEVAMTKVEGVCAEYIKDNAKGGIIRVDIGTDGTTANKLMTKIRELVPEACCLLYSIDEEENKVGFYVTCSKSANDKGFSAVEWLKPVAVLCGGKGGGKANLAQGQGKDIKHIEEAIKKAEEIFATL